MARSVVLLFPGQGAQYPGMAVDLYHRHTTFRAAMDEVLSLWGNEGRAIRADWLADWPLIDLDDLRRAQPLLFAVDHALAVTLREAGIVPVALLGHSVGEVVAAVAAGVLSLPEAAGLLAERIAQLGDAPPGGMLSVAASPADVRPFLTDEVALGAVNAARSVVLAGPAAPLEDARARLRAAGFTTLTVPARVPFHSPVLGGHAARSLSSVRRLTWAPPAVPLYSGYTGGLLGPAAATDPDFWAAQPARPVYFADALAAVATAGDQLLVECGPGWTLTIPARRSPQVLRAGTPVIPLLPRRAGASGSDLRHVAEAIAGIVEAAGTPGSDAVDLPTSVPPTKVTATQLSG
ncbi:Acyl transferase domain-containing protein [Frankia sp. AiPs1]|uniref:acyltransferase domain-containing protein n=1 Tax=Frankia sp. AiPa1 TaxID=573492 RepID=UPI00202B181B|nr:acyltransferase domain-containing protein [Frankia sp. AiPa1]MCL9760508.1 acyltransferase domain-containing protein [Frankia sp. AiPa1]